jgi:hypothetical protein
LCRRVLGQGERDVKGPRIRSKSSELWLAAFYLQGLAEVPRYIFRHRPNGLNGRTQLGSRNAELLRPAPDFPLFVNVDACLVGLAAQIEIVHGFLLCLDGTIVPCNCVLFMFFSTLR